jgi:hypothetical protein
MPTPETVIAAVRSRGSNARDLRDAAHEAHHALEMGVPPGEWGRDKIGQAVMACSRSTALASEVMARAVEQLVCERLNEPYNRHEWMLLACLEAEKNGVSVPSVTWMDKAVATAIAQPSAQRAADAVLALPQVPFARTAPPARRGVQRTARSSS